MPYGSFSLFRCSGVDRNELRSVSRKDECKIPSELGFLGRLLLALLAALLLLGCLLLHCFLFLLGHSHSSIKGFWEDARRRLTIPSTCRPPTFTSYLSEVTIRCVSVRFVADSNTP